MKGEGEGQENVKEGTGGRVGRRELPQVVIYVNGKLTVEIPGFDRVSRYLCSPAWPRKALYEEAICICRVSAKE